ncbi:hypothetical protein L0244_08775 [bacterium]|nr:hypothetical protein [bacterium]MCI0613070.1 hypothetical protein [bacterium]
MTELERKQKELLEMMSFSLNSLYNLVGSQNPRLQPRRKLKIFYDTLAKLDREALWSSQKEEFKQLLLKR